MKRAMLAAVLLLASSCATRQPMTGQQAPDLDKKLSTFAYVEDGKLATLIVDTRPTRYREKEPYAPVEIAVANHGVKQLSLTRESFTLADEKGNRYPCASPKERS
jgi:type IV pilus biogenesis protein CpaD/CtpE